MLPTPLALVLAVAVLLVDALAERLRPRRRRGAVTLIAIVLPIVLVSGIGSLRPFVRGWGDPSPAAGATATTGNSTYEQASGMAAPTASAIITTSPVAFAPAPATPTATATSAPTATPSSLPSPTALPLTPTATAAAVTPRGTTVIPILMYHYVRTVTDPKDTIGIGLSVTPELFAAQMQYLADSGYTTLTMSEVHAILAGKLPLPERPIALTFDDGYRDFYMAAWPVLRKHNFKATNYVISGFIGWDAYMTWEMLHELDASGLVEIGAHTQTHSDLRAMGQDRRWREIAGSKAILEEGLGHPVTAFCYPAGKYDADVVALVRQAGFLTATTVEYGTKQNLQWAFDLPRVRVHGPDTFAIWKSKLP